MNLDQDKVILIDQDNQVVGEMDKIDAHRGKGLVHRAISVFLFDKNGRLLIQQRSSNKIVGAGQWANTVCGHVRPGESTIDCAYRRLHEELGIINVKIKPIHQFYYQVKCNDDFSENELDEVFVGEYDGQVIPNEKEVRGFKWVDFKDLIRNKDRKNLVPWLKIMLNNEDLMKKLA